MVMKQEFKFLQSPTPDELRQVRREINNTYPNKQEDSVRELQAWMESQPHLPRNYDERILPRMLIGCKYDMNRAKSKLDAYYCSRLTLPEFYGQRDPTSPEMQLAWKAITILPLPRTREDGTRVTLHLMNEVDTADHVPQDIYKLFFMMGDIRLVQEAEISGDVYIFDAAHASVSILLRHAGSMLKKALSQAQDAYPQRLKEIHIINAHPFFAKTINVFRSFMKEKMRNRFFVHQSLDTLHQHVPKHLLPVEYGGDRLTVEQLQDQWSKVLESYALYFQQQEGVKADESKMLQSRKNKKTSERLGCRDTDIQGTQGCFRSLCLD